jgi:glycosyltransferase involved in cell wall biosynthesis
VRIVLNQADRVIALSKDSEWGLRALLGGDRVLRAPNPTTLAPPRSIEQTGKVILFGGEISLRKGVDVLVAAWPQVRAVHGDARCLVVGPPGDYTVPETPGIEVRPPVSADEMRALIEASRVVVLPSRAEAMPMILTEAIGAGRPFVASRVGGVAELAVCEGQLVAPEDVGGLAAALSALLSAPGTAQEIGDAGRALWEQTRSPRALGDFYRRMYGEAISASAGRR